MSLNGEFCRGVNCNFTNIEGVERLSSKKGLDIISLCTEAGDKMAKIEKMVTDLVDRLARLENKDNGVKLENSLPILEIRSKLQSLESTISGAEMKSGSDLKARLDKFEELLNSDDLRGPTGPQGPQGAKGAKGADRLQDLKDVCLDGMDDGCVLVYRKEKGKFVTEPLE